MDNNRQQPRPTWTSPSVLKAAAAEIAALIPDICDSDEAIGQLADALRYESPAFDAYKIARHLEQFHSWECDMSVVEACETAWPTIHEHLRKEVATWVVDCAIQPQHELGDLVRINTWGPNGKRGDFDGEIVKIDLSQAIYTVMIPELGHVREGIGCSGLLLPFEGVESSSPLLEGATTSA